MKAGFKSFLVYRLLAPADLDTATLAERLVHLPAGGPAVSQMQRSGFLPTISGNDELLTDLGSDKHVLTLQTALRIVPNKVVKRELALRVREWEERYGRVPGRDEKASLKNEVIIALMENALIDYSRINVLISKPWVFIETSSVKKAELVLGAMRKVLGSLPVQPLTPAKPVVSSFTDWVSKKSEPAQLKVGEAFKAQGKLAGGQVLTGKSVDLEDVTLSELLEQDYQVIALELQYYNDGLHGTTSFMLNENMMFKSVSWPDALVDLAQEDAGDDESGINLAKATFLLTASALDDLVDGVMVSLGGEAVRNLGDDELEKMKAALKGWSVTHVNGEELDKPVSLAGDDEDPDWRDPLYEQAVNFVIEKQKASISSVQREFRIGYNRSTRIIEAMETDGIICPIDGNGVRHVWLKEPWKLGDTNLNTDFGLCVQRETELEETELEDADDEGLI